MVDESLTLFRIRRRFLRSTQLERDWLDPDALQDYILTNQARQSIEQFVGGLTHGSGLRAWRITGDYGSGKSSFGLLIATLFYSGLNKLPNSIKISDNEDVSLYSLKHSPHLFPILITGAREPVGLAIVRGLQNAFANSTETVPESMTNEWNEALNAKKVDDSQVLAWLKITHKHLINSGQAKGTFLLLDEAGKFLEFAALYPDRQDVYLLQSIAEFAARSGPHPFYVTALLHQGISAYAETLPIVQQREWEKVAGRFEEILWHQPAEQLAELIANALDVRVDYVGDQHHRQTQTDMEAVIKMHWYGAVVAERFLSSLAVRLYPLHPTVVPPLIRLFANFGQNERSLFAFLLGNEPFGLQDFVERTDGKQFFCLHNLYDYVRNVFGPRMHNHNHRGHWTAIQTIVSQLIDSKSRYNKLVKTIGLLNVLNADDLIPSDELLQLALPGEDNVNHQLAELKHAQHLYYRGRSGGYSIWPHTSINLDTAYEKAKKTVTPVGSVSTVISDWLDTKPVIARRHYIQKGTLRYFEVIHCYVSLIKDYIEGTFDADGRIIVPLCETVQHRTLAVELASEPEMRAATKVLIAIPAPLEGLKSLVTECQRWEWIERNTSGLEHDRFAREEVSRQIVAAETALQNQIRQTIGITATSEVGGTEWFWRGVSKPCIDARATMHLLTEVFDEVYNEAPLIYNELINRRLLSSAASAARLRLIDLLFRSPDQPYIGLEADKTPPEMSMYLSVIQQPGLHREIEGKWSVVLPDKACDFNNLLPTFERIRAVLYQRADERVSIDFLSAELRKEPYGVRDGLFYLLLAIYTVINEQELAFYEDGTFIPRVTGNVFQRITKAPESFEIQYFPLNHVRTGLFRELSEKLNLGKTGSQRIDLLDVVKPLASFAAALPKYSTLTKRLTPQAIDVRDALKTARDPANLLFSELPKACGLRKIDKRESRQEEVAQPFVVALQSAIDEIQSAYPNLLQHILLRLFAEFQIEGTAETRRATLAVRAQLLSKYVTEVRLKSFCLRLADSNLPEQKWAESLGSLVCSSPPAAWRDADVHRYEQEIHNLCSQFLRVEAVAFQSSIASQSHDAVRIALTKASGEEVERVLYLSEEGRTQVDFIKQKVMSEISKNGQLGIIAATHLLWDMLQEQQTGNQ